MEKSETLTKQVASQKTAESEAKKETEIGICPIPQLSS